MKKVVLTLAALMAAAATTPAFAADAAAGKAKYDILCASCHGASGKGDGPAGGAMNPKPRNFTDAAWQKATNDETVKKAIAEGGKAVGKSPMMPGWKAALKPADIDNVTAYVRQLGGAK